MAIYEPRDKYYRKARERGLPSRAAFKIEELISRAKLSLRGARIADLRCAPGGWLVILAHAAGPQGRVVRVDLAPCANLPGGATTIVGDITDSATIEHTLDALAGTADLVTSDLAPKLTGIAARDEARSQELLIAALTFANRSLRQGGAMIAKAFMGSEFKKVIAEYELSFSRVEIKRTAATRPGSSELYIVARDFQGAKQKAG